MKKLIALFLAFFATIFSFALRASNSDSSRRPKPPQTTVVSVEPTTEPEETTVAPDPIPAFSIQVSFDGKDYTFTEADAVGLPITTRDMKTVNKAGTETEYTFTGVTLKDLLTSLGAADLTGGVVKAVATDNYVTILGNEYVVADDTLFAWEGSGNAADYPRLCPGSSTQSSLYAKNVATIELTQIPDFNISVIIGSETKTFTQADAAKLIFYTLPMTAINSKGVVTNYVFTGVRLKDALKALGVTNLTGLSAKVTGTDGFVVSLANDLLIADDTLFSWVGTGSAADYPRVSPGSTDVSSKYAKMVASIELV